MSDPLEITPPQQNRSQQTMNKIMDAAAALLETKSFDELTINEIVAEAGCSVGAFYGRFKDKETLLHALDDRYVERYLEMGKVFLRPGPRTDQDLQETVRELVEVTIQLNEMDPGLMRTLVLSARLSQDPRFREREDRIHQLFPAVAGILLHHRKEIRHPDPELAVQFGLLQMFITARELAIWPHMAANNPVRGEEFAAELTRSLVSYLKGQST